jgi:putative membrane protein
VERGLSDAEIVVLYERQVLAPRDKRAYRLVLEASRDIGLLTALSPLGLMDGVLVLWRTTMMLRSIARAYGLALSPAASFSLLKSCIRNAAIAGLADAVSHAAVEHVGASLTALISARAGQGAGNALLAGRLGLEAIRLTRPLPFIKEPPPRLSHVRAAIFDSGGKVKQEVG